MLNNITLSHPSDSNSQNKWKSLLWQMLRNTLVYSVLSAAAIMVMFAFALPFFRRLLPGWEMHWVANGITGILTVLAISPFLRAIVMKKNRSDEFKALWAESRMNHLPLIFTIVVRVVIACAFIFYIVNYLSRFTNALMVSIALALILAMILSRSLKHSSIRMERLFVKNLRSRDIGGAGARKAAPSLRGASSRPRCAHGRF